MTDKQKQGKNSMWNEKRICSECGDEAKSVTECHSHHLETGHNSWYKKGHKEVKKFS